MALPELTTLQWAGAGLAGLLVGLSKAGFGAGSAILSIPLMVAVLGPADMLSVMLLVLIAGDVFALVHYPRTHHARSLAMLLPGLVVGVGLGWVSLRWFRALEDGPIWMARLIGALCVGFVAVQFFQMMMERRSGRERAPYRPRAWHGVGIGAGAGLTSTLAHAGGPLLVLFLVPQKLDRRVYVGTCIKYFFAGNLVKLIPYFREGLMTATNAALSLALVPAVVVGTLLGVQLNRRFSDRSFRLVIYCLAFLFGLYLLTGRRASREGPPAEPPDRPAERELFEQGLSAHARGDHPSAARAFARAAEREGRALTEARFNLALSLFHEGRYADAADRFLALRADADGVVGARCLFNAGNCAYRTAAFDRAAGLYEEALRECADELARPETRSADAATLEELRERAAFNLAAARARARPETARREQRGGAALEPAGAPGPEGAAGEGLPQESRQGIERPSVGRAGAEAEGRRPVAEVLDAAAAGDTGPVVRAGRGPQETAGPRW